VKERMIGWWGPIVEEYYAGTEHIGSTSITSAEWLEHKGSVGRPSYGAVVHVCDDEGRELPVGETGTVYFEDASATFEYHGDRAKTESLQHPGHPGWRTLGDVGHVDADGYLYLSDRKAFMIVSGGVNIYPREIEDVLVSHPRVVDAAVFGVPDGDMGEAVMAVVQPLDPGDAGDRLEDELRSWCEERLAGYKRPRRYDVVAQLPRLDNGKLYKAGLREPYWQGHGSRVL
jgi:long-chain acyl-CoA synthetase